LCTNRQFLARNRAGRIFRHRLSKPDLTGGERQAMDRGVAGNDAVEVVGISLCCGQRLTPTCRTAVEVRELGAAP
jgi:hypothetical protein